MQILLNIVLYAFLAYWLYDSLVEHDYWYAFVVGFVVACVYSADTAARLSCVKDFARRVPV